MDLVILKRKRMHCGLIKTSLLKHWLQTNNFDIQLNIVSNPFPKAKHHYPSVSDKLEVIIEKATQKDKKDRFQSCDEFIKSFDAPIQKIKNVVEITKNIKTKTKETIPGNKVEVKEKRNYSLPIVIGVVVVIIALVLFQINENNNNYILAEKERVAEVEKKEKLIIKQKKIDKQIEEKRLAEIKRQEEENRLAQAERQRNRNRYWENVTSNGEVKGLYGAVFYEEPNERSKELGYLNTGTLIEIRSNVILNNYCYVRLRDGRDGYLHKSTVRSELFKN